MPELAKIQKHMVFKKGDADPRERPQQCPRKPMRAPTSPTGCKWCSAQALAERVAQQAERTMSSYSVPPPPPKLVILDATDSSCAMAARASVCTTSDELAFATRAQNRFPMARSAETSLCCLSTNSGLRKVVDGGRGVAGEVPCLQAHLLYQ